MLTAIINQQQCIGCSRCIPACPVDAIVGAKQQLHAVLSSECIGCKLCVAPCPVDCIEIKPLQELLPADQQIDKAARAKKAKQRYQARQQRLAEQTKVQLPFVNDPNYKNQIHEYLGKVKQKQGSLVYESK